MATGAVDQNEDPLADPAPAKPGERPPGWTKRHRRAITVVITLAAIVGFIVFVVPQISGLSHTLHRLRNGDPWWIAAGVVSEMLSLGGYILLFRAVFSCGIQIGWRESYQINLAGTVATKLFGTAGAGGVALTVWALRASGLQPRSIARRMITFELLLYSVFVWALVVVGVGLRTGLLEGRSPWTLTVVPALFGGAVILAAISLRALPTSAERRLAARANASGGRIWRLLQKVAAAPATLRESSSVAFELLRDREFGVLGAVAYWGFDIGALWASLHAFGSPPPFPTVIMAYFLGQLANVLPLPGGVGGVEGGMIGVLIAFGAQGSQAILGVLAYRIISFWLPTLPGGIAYVRLRRTVEGWRSDRAEKEAAASAAEGDEGASAATGPAGAGPTAAGRTAG